MSGEIFTYQVIARRFIEIPSGPTPPEPIPAFSGSVLFDGNIIGAINTYDSGSYLNGLNSGSNEWNNVTPLASYVANIHFITVMANDGNIAGDISNYSSASLLNGLNGGNLVWDSAYDYVAAFTYYGVKAYDSPTLIFNLYETGSYNNISGGYSIGIENGGEWVSSYLDITLEIGVQGFDRISGSYYIMGTEVNGSGSNYISDERYLTFTGSNWIGETIS